MGRACEWCEGKGSVPLMKSWFLADGFRRNRCGVCSGTGINPPGFHADREHRAFLAHADEHIAAWGGLSPPRPPGSDL